MPELCFLMFLIGCGYILYSSLMYFFTPREKLPFQIPSTQRLNLVWGFVFYGFALSLLSHSAFLRTIDCILSLILTVYALYLSCYRHFFCGGFCPVSPLFKSILSKKLQRKTDLSSSNTPKILGLNAFEVNDPQLIEIQYQRIISTLQKRNFFPPELKKIIDSARKMICR